MSFGFGFLFLFLWGKELGNQTSKRRMEIRKYNRTSCPLSEWDSLDGEAPTRTWERSQVQLFKSHQGGFWVGREKLRPRFKKKKCSPFKTATINNFTI